MKFRTADLSGVALNYAVLMALRLDDTTVTLDSGKTMRRFSYIDRKGCATTLSKAAAIFDMADGSTVNPSTDWSDGGPLIERALMSLDYAAHATNGKWMAETWTKDSTPSKWGRGDTPLVAAMRCFVAENLGDVVDVPARLSQS